MTLRVLACALLGALTPSHVQAFTYDEATQGDLSGAPASPTAFTLDLGSNVISGTAGFTTFFDVDIISFTIPEGMQLDGIAVDAFHNDFGLSFFGLQPGTPWLDTVGGAITGEHLIGYALIDNESGATNLLVEMQKIASPPRYEIPLPSGVYTLEMQDLDTGFSYAFDFQTSATIIPPDADFDGDGTVDADDLKQWAGDFALNADSDADGDADSDGNDFLIWQRQLSPPIASPVPEPHAAALAVWGLAAVYRRGRRRIAGPRIGLRIG